MNATLMCLADQDNLDSRLRSLLKENMDFMERTFDGLGFCLSKEGDLLSQWRGYADDARGVSIGFHRTYLEELATVSESGKLSASKDWYGFALKKVEYDPSKQLANIEPVYRKLRDLIDPADFKPQVPGLGLFGGLRSATETPEEADNVRKAENAKWQSLMELVPYLFELKGDAFKEEQEWRLVSLLIRGVSDVCLYRASADRIIPYRAYRLDESELKVPAIARVVLGPKHQTPKGVVESMLKQADFGDVEVVPSKATYR